MKHAKVESYVLSVLEKEGYINHPEFSSAMKKVA